MLLPKLYINQAPQQPGEIVQIMAQNTNNLR